jgi:hypothetical protein
MALITEELDASTALQAPPPVDAGAYIASLRKQAGFIVGSVDKIAQKFFHVSLIQQCVEPLAGDWTQLQTAQGGWKNMAAALEASAVNYESATRQLQGVWEGAAAAAAGARLVDVADLHRHQAQGCRLVSEQLTCIIDAAKSAGELVASLLSILNDFLMRLAIEAAVPVVGWFAGAFDIAAHAGKFWKLVNRINHTFSTLIKLISKLMRVIGLVQKVFGTANKVIGKTGQGVEMGASTLWLDDAARVQFGVG